MIDDTLTEKLAAVGLTRARPSTRLGDFLEKYTSTRRGLKPASLKKLNQTKAKLLAYFDADILIRSVLPDDAADWEDWLAGQDISEATVRQHCGNAKGIFNAAVRRGLLRESPFRHLRSGSTASKNARYVTPAEADKVLEACPSLEWKLLFGLARFAGLRVPSETHLLTWGDINWESNRLTVRSPKTEHHAGHGQRLVPMVPQLAAIMQDAFDMAEDGQERVITLGRGGQLHRRLTAIVRQAGVEPWKDAFQTLRRSCEKEWAMTFPQYAVSKWIGHSITISGKHYANAVPDELFAQAVKGGEGEALQNALQNAPETKRTEANEQKRASGRRVKNPSKSRVLRESSPSCSESKKWSRGDSNPRAATVSKPRLRV